jgi:hypothetical protein
VPSNVHRTGIHFDARNDSRIDDGFNNEYAIIFLLADRLGAKDGTTNALTKIGSSHEELAISTPNFNGLGIPKLAKRLLQVGLHSSIANRPLSPVTSALAQSVSGCTLIWRRSFALLAIISSKSPISGKDFSAVQSMEISSQPVRSLANIQTMAGGITIAE